MIVLTLLIGLSNDSSPSEMTDEVTDVIVKKMSAMLGVPEKKSTP